MEREERKKTNFRPTRGSARQAEAVASNDAWEAGRRVMKEKMRERAKREGLGVTQRGEKYS